MKPDKLAKIVTPAVVLALLAFAVVRKSGFDWRVPKSAVQQSATAWSTPQDTVYATLEAARAGDSKAYLDLYSGPMRVTLDQIVAEKGDAGFREYLKSTSAALKGLAVFDPTPSSDGEVQLRVEYVYQDRNEVQVLTLAKASTGWKIVRSDNAERIKTLVPYGTPVR